MITREQVADLQSGDVVRIVESYEDGSRYVHEGPVRADGGNALMFGDLWLRTGKGDAPEWVDELTVVSRAPRPLYVNHPRTEPVPGDIVNYKSRSSGAVVGPFLYGYVERWAGTPTNGQMTRWVGLPGCYPDTGPLYNAGSLTLLVDGETGQVVQ